MKPLLVANWKMQLSIEQSVAAAKEIAAASFDGVQVVVCPSFPVIPQVQYFLQTQSSPVVLGAQDAFAEDWGAYTGAVSAAMLSDICRYVIIGHSERRQHFHETDQLIQAKVASVVRHGMTPILCVGESAEDRQAGRSVAVVKAQLAGALTGVDAISSLVVAYEPVWAIGTNGVAAEPADVAAMRTVIQEAVSQLLPNVSLTLLYGGSVSAETIKQYVAPEMMDGALVGRASVVPSELIAMAQAIKVS